MSLTSLLPSPQPWGPWKRRSAARGVLARPVGYRDDDAFVCTECGRAKIASIGVELRENRWPACCGNVMRLPPLDEVGE